MYMYMYDDSAFVSLSGQWSTFLTDLWYIKVLDPLQTGLKIVITVDWSRVQPLKFGGSINITQSCC